VAALQPKADRLVVGREVAPSTGTVHLQGYVRFVKSIRFSGVKKLLPRAHIEERKGAESQATAYCKKDGSILVDHGIDADRGTGPRERKRSRDEEASEVIEEIEKGQPYGAIRNRHKLFCFWHRRHVVDYINDTAFARSHPGVNPPSSYSNFNPTI